MVDDKILTKEKKRFTTIRVSPSTLSSIAQLKIHPRQPLEEIIKKLLGIEVSET